MSPDRLEDLMLRACAGDRLALDDLIRFMTPFLIHLARGRLDRRIRHLCDPEDCLQDTFLALFKHPWEVGLFTTVDEMLAYVTRTATNVVYTAYRRYLHSAKRDERRHVALSGDVRQAGPSAEDEVDDVDDFEVYLLSVSSEMRQVLLLLRERYSTVEVARLLRMGDRKIRHLIEEARRRHRQEEERENLELAAVRPLHETLRCWCVRHAAEERQLAERAQRVSYCGAGAVSA
jgi:DNA-directed RNA polymerase specialized sigma24 family protein